MICFMPRSEIEEQNTIYKILVDSSARGVISIPSGGEDAWTYRLHSTCDIVLMRIGK